MCEDIGLNRVLNFPNCECLPGYFYDNIDVKCQKCDSLCLMCKDQGDICS